MYHHNFYLTLLLHIRKISKTSFFFNIDTLAQITLLSEENRFHVSVPLVLETVDSH